MTRMRSFGWPAIKVGCSTGDDPKFGQKGRKFGEQFGF